jgi:uncharacterized membrane protein
MAHGISTFAERARGSLFVIPVIYVVAGIALAEALLWVDTSVDGLSGLPVVGVVTVDSARAVLSTIATATMTISGIAFSVSLLVIQLASSQYTPRVVHNLVRDPFTKQVMGIVLATFAYCLVVLRSVRGPLDEGGEAVIPALALAVAMVLGIVAVLAIVAFINHSAHSMDISELLHDVTSSSLDSLADTWPSDPAPDLALATPPSEPGFEVGAAENGWVQRIDVTQLLDVLPPGGTVLVHTTAGRYAVAGSPLCTLWPPPTADRREAVTAEVQGATLLGRSRTMQQDVSYGVRQLVDVALRALSPGLNDPTTAQDAIFNLAAVLRSALARPEPARATSHSGGRCLLQPELPNHESLVALAYDELRLTAASNPAVCTYLLESIDLLRRTLGDACPTAAVTALRSQARLIVAGLDPSLPDHDRAHVIAAYEARFGNEGEGT